MSIPSTVGQIGHEMPPKPWFEIQAKREKNKACCKIKNVVHDPDLQESSY